MKRIASILATLLWLTAGNALAWSNHSLAAYRAFEKMPELANAQPVLAEPLEAFLKDQEKAVQDLLASQESWAQSQLDFYPPRPAQLAFKANPAQSDAARRMAFLMALRVAPNSRFALYLQPDPWRAAPDPATLLAHSAVDSLPEQPLSLIHI